MVGRGVRETIFNSTWDVKKERGEIEDGEKEEKEEKERWMV